MSKINKIILSALSEAKQRGNLYHATTYMQLLNILKENKMYAYRPIGISVSRSPSISNNFGDGTVIVLDGDKLSEKYKIFPFSYQGEDVGEEVIQTNKNLPIHYKTPEHNNAFLSLIGRVDDGMADENEFANQYEGSELPNVLKYITEIRLPKEYCNLKSVKKIEELCSSHGYDLPKIDLSKKYNFGIEKTNTKGDIEKRNKAFDNNSLRNLNPKDRADLEQDFDNAGYDLPYDFED